jgi:hypothetical protein
MKLHIENLHVTFSNPQPPAGFLATLAIAGAMQATRKDAPSARFHFNPLTL